MTQNQATFELKGGLDLVTPAIALPPGRCVAAVNYEADFGGYRRSDGYERFDGQPSPSAGADAAATAARRSAILAVPGTGPVRGVWVYNGRVWAFRDDLDGTGAMYRSTVTGWEKQVFGSSLSFSTATAQFGEGQIVVGATSGATAMIRRVVTQSGVYTGTATGYLVVADIVGLFVTGEIVTSSSGSATATTILQLALAAGGKYEFVSHNFFGSTRLNRMYFVSGGQSGFEWDGRTLVPIHTGVSSGPLAVFDMILAQNGDFLIAQNGDFLILQADFDKPTHIAQFSNHMFLSFPGGSVLHSGVGQPLDYRVTSGAGEIGIGDEVTGFVSGASTAFIITCRSRIDAITGTDMLNFSRQTVSSGSGAFANTAQMLDQPVFLDDGGLRQMQASQSYGDWRIGTITELVEPLIRLKRLANVAPVASVVVRARAQYRMYWQDGTAISVFFGRKTPETMPLKVPMSPNCACSGEVVATDGRDRVFLGGNDGFVYESDVGTSFDGAVVPAFMQWAWNQVGGIRQNKRFHSVAVDLDAPDPVALGVSFQVDYNRPPELAGPQVNLTASAGTRGATGIAYHADLVWTAPVQGQFQSELQGIGQNMALTVVSNATTEKPHVMTAMTVYFTPRRSQRLNNG